MPDTALVLLGVRAGWERSVARDADPRYAGRHFTLPAVHPDELPVWVASADVALCTLPPLSYNQRYTTPNKFLEAMAGGTPMVLGPRPADDGGAPAREEDLGRVAASMDPPDIAAAIRAILDLPRGRARGLARAHRGDRAGTLQLADRRGRLRDGLAPCRGARLGAWLRPVNGTVVAHVVGARPNFMKAAPVIRALAARGVAQRVIHTGQHYDDADVGRLLPRPRPARAGPQPRRRVRVARRPDGRDHGRPRADVPREIRPALAVVYGDVNSTIAAALVAAKLGLPIAHVEAGLRSFDDTMPEEINRRVTDLLSDLLFVTVPEGVDNLVATGTSRASGSTSSATR